MAGLLRASAVYTISNVVPKVGAVFLVPIYVRVLSPPEYGTVALLTTLVGLLTMVFRLGMDGSLIRLHFDADGPERGRLYGSAMAFTLVVAAIGTGLLALAGPIVFELLPGGIPFFPLGLLTLIVAFATSVGFVPSAFYRATRQAGKYALFNLGGFVLTSSAILFMILVPRLGAAGVMAAQALAGTAMLLVALSIVRSLASISARATEIRSLLALGLPLVPHAIAGWALRLMDRWLIGLFIGLPAAQTLAAIGAYSFGYQIGSVVTILVASFNAAWAPYFYGVAQRPQAPRVYREMTTVVLGCLFVVAVGLSAISNELVQVIARPGYEAASDVITVVALGAVFHGVYTMFVNILFVAKRTGRLALITGGSVIVNLVLNAVLVPAMGIVGAAWATVGAYACFAAATYLYARRLYPMHVDMRRLLVCAALGVATALAARVLASPDVVASGATGVLLSLAYAVVVGAIVYRPLRRLVPLAAEMRTAAAAERRAPEPA